ncbi:MAG: hypothetical protein EA401_12780 [Planctomycetota bacterium]|nr:MAG: hypothetical protein EA401_12780 [Planctomycetota bacterium]
MTASFTPETGQRITVTRHKGRSDYQVGENYTVSCVDSSDHTLKATNAAGKELGWINWDCVRPADTIDWLWLREQLSPETVLFLEAFDGLNHLIFNDQLADEILLELPDLEQHILRCQESSPPSVSQSSQSL